MCVKKFLLIFVVAFVPLTIVVADDSEKKSASKTVEFLSKDGSFLKKEFYDLPSVGGTYNRIDFQVLILTDLKNNEKYGCLRITTYYISSIMNTSANDSYIGTLDSDELDACIVCFEKISSEFTVTSALTYTEVEYKTRDGVKLGTFWNEVKSEWKTYIQTKSYSSHSMSTVPSNKVSFLIGNLKQAKQMIAEKTAM